MESKNTKAKRRSKTKSPLEEVREGLYRLAFGSTTDAVKLLFFEEAPSPAELSGLDLFHIAEVKRGKNGVEVKLFDRFKAMEALARIAQAEEAGDGALPFYSAILGSVNDEADGESYEA
ncbi:MAG: terminase small subunit [Hydrogenoanaerobacterium sp.]